MPTRKQRLRAKLRKQGREVSVPPTTHEERRHRTFREQQWDAYNRAPRKPPSLPLLSEAEARALVTPAPFELIRGPRNAK